MNPFLLSFFFFFFTTKNESGVAPSCLQVTEVVRPAGAVRAFRTKVEVRQGASRQSNGGETLLGESLRTQRYSP